MATKKYGTLSSKPLKESCPEALTDAELIRKILRCKKTGSFNVSKGCDASYSITKDLAKCHCAKEIQTKYGLNKLQAISLLAAVELAKRINAPTDMDCDHITSPAVAAGYFMTELRYENHERFLVMLLNTKNRIIRIEQVSEGSLTSAIVHPREVFAFAIIHHAACIIVSHNHPTGDPCPSFDDKSLTQKLEEVGSVLGIPLLDHIIIGDGSYYSFKEHGNL